MGDAGVGVGVVLWESLVTLMGAVHGLQGLQRGQRAVPVILLFFPPRPGD